jgi:four helix bundle protein
MAGFARTFGRTNYKHTPSQGTSVAPVPYMGGARQDLCARAFRLSLAVLACYSKVVKRGRAQAHLADQLLAAATSVGANIEEGQAASSRRDMAAKYGIALREARETRYWLRLLAASDAAREIELLPLIQETEEFVAMLTVSVRRLREPAEE